jgi:hypothetical protein
MPRLGIALVAAATAFLAGAPLAAGSSIVYVKGGNVYRAAPSGHGHVVVRAPGATVYQVVTQDDRGRIWAVHYPSRKWQRFDVHGRRIGRPFNTAGTGLGLQYDLGRNLPGFVGPLDPQVSDDGRVLGSWGILDQVTHINPHPLPGESRRTTPSSRPAPRRRSRTATRWRTPQPTRCSGSSAGRRGCATGRSSWARSRTC